MNFEQMTQITAAMLAGSNKTSDHDQGRFLR